MSTRKVIAPTFRYPGGKALLAPTIVSFIPKQGRKFIDVFAGRGNITFRAIAEGLQYQQWVVNDINRAPFFRALRDYGDQFKTTEKSKAEFDRLAELAKTADPHALIMEPYVAFNGGTYDSGGSTTEGGRRSPQSYERNVRLACDFLRSRNVRITDLDWLNCLEAEQLSSDDFVMFDPPYLDCDVGAYEPDMICPTELIEYLQSAKFQWAFTEYAQPLYLRAFGQPVLEREVQLRAPNFQDTDGQDRRIECIWTSSSYRDAMRDSVMFPSSPVPDDRTDTFYSGLPEQELLREIRECVVEIEKSRNQINKEMRKRLLPALEALKQRTARKKPGYEDHLKAIGLNGARVRQWSHRSRTADEVANAVEQNSETTRGGKRRKTSVTSVQVLLANADQLAKAVLESRASDAILLAQEYEKARRGSSPLNTVTSGHEISPSEMENLILSKNANSSSLPN